MSQVTLVFQTTQTVGVIKKLLLREFQLESVSGSFEWQLKGDAGVVTAYSSGKIVIQSRDKGWAEEVYDFLKQNFGDEDGFIPHIGVDEAGKGDFFGPMVIAAVYIDSKELNEKLMKLGVRDSKTISDERAIELREQIVTLAKYTSEVVLSPKRYSELHLEMGNVNKLLAWGHARSIENILEGLPKEDRPAKAVIDQFAKRESRVLDALLKNGKKLEIEQKHKGESDLAVAAASIVARGRFLLELESLGEKYKTEFPKGASQVIQFAKDFVEQWGPEELKEVAKTTFKTTEKVLSMV